jgi:hypothetical protein
VLYLAPRNDRYQVESGSAEEPNKALSGDITSRDLRLVAREGVAKISDLIRRFQDGDVADCLETLARGGLIT